jgi:hypothetical protein
MQTLPKFRHNAAAILLCVAGLVCAATAQDAKASGKSVQIAKQAVRIGEAALLRKYGRGVLAERPFHAKLEKRVWIVQGTTYCQEQLPSPTFYCPPWHWVRIAQKDGRILATGEGQATNQ